MFYLVYHILGVVTAYPYYQGYAFVINPHNSITYQLFLLFGEGGCFAGSTQSNNKFHSTSNYVLYNPFQGRYVHLVISCKGGNQCYPCSFKFHNLFYLRMIVLKTFFTSEANNSPCAGEQPITISLYCRSIP